MTSVTTARLLLRDASERDRGRLIDMLCDPLARAHLGGARSRAEAEARLPAELSEVLPFPEASYVIADRAADQFLGTVRLDRRSPDRPGHIRPEGNELELSYILLPAFWGKGYAEEATRALLSTTAVRHGEDEPILVITQSSNARSIALMKKLGFVERQQFELWGATQTLAVAQLSAFRPQVSADAH